MAAREELKLFLAAALLRSRSDEVTFSQAAGRPHFIICAQRKGSLGSLSNLVKR
ncbi:protein of unknown function [Shewanella benthica]|uniref:Uncharacterized protein n=1 Tax=Shewanella benthica TaxID=43661 RepID=A0A330M886_9GAMM|nr:protein of unknown function [Shewanella benthica]